MASISSSTLAQMDTARRILLTLCVKEHIPFKESLIDDYLTWKEQNPQHGTLNAYQKCSHFIKQFPSYTTHVMIKTMAGDLIPIEYDEKQGLHGLAVKLNHMDPTTFPPHFTKVFRLQEEDCPVEENEVFGVLIHAPAYSIRINEVDTWIQADRQQHVTYAHICYRFTIHLSDMLTQPIPKELRNGIHTNQPTDDYFFDIFHNLTTGFYTTWDTYFQSIQAHSSQPATTMDELLDSLVFRQNQIQTIINGQEFEATLTADAKAELISAFSAAKLQ